jgi:hypothetical protein
MIGGRKNYTGEVSSPSPGPKAAPDAHPGHPGPRLPWTPIRGSGAQKEKTHLQTPKPPFTPPDAARKAQAIAEVEAERREAATAEAGRRRRRKRQS